MCYHNQTNLVATDGSAASSSSIPFINLKLISSRGYQSSHDLYLLFECVFIGLIPAHQVLSHPTRPRQGCLKPFHGNPALAPFHEAIRAGIKKVNKYYCNFVTIPAVLLALCKSFSTSPGTLLTIFLVLHPYFKLDYILHKWGGKKEQDEAKAKGEQDAVDWQAQAMSLIKDTVGARCIIRFKS
jgi:hypothetical protein